NATLLAVVAEKTGYPAEMLEPDMALDADLGIDSIKRVEILSALQERLPEAPPVRPEHLGTLRTLRHIAAFLAGNEPNGAASGRAPAGEGQPPDDSAASPTVRSHQGVDAPRSPDGVERSVLCVVPLPDGAACDPVRLAPGAELWLAADDAAL